MKKIISLIIAVVMICAIGVTAAGCKKSGGNTTSGGGKIATSGVPAGLEGVTEDEIAALTNTGKVTFYECCVGGAGTTMDNKSRTDWYAGFKKYFKDSYGGELEPVAMSWDRWEKNFLTEYAAGTAPMLVYLFERNWPMFANRGLVYNVAELEKAGVKCLNSPVLSENLKAVQNIYTYNKNTYTFAVTMVEPDMIFVNEDIFADAGVKSPSAYYKEGKWDINNFFKSAKAVTKDTDNDGKTDQYGYYGWDDNFFVGNNGGQLVALDENGTLKVTMTDTKVKNAFANIQQLAVTDKSYKKDTSGKWEDGKLGMIAWMPRNEARNIKDKLYKFKVSVIPFPLGQDNATGVHTCKAYAWTVTKAAKNLKEMQAAVNFVIAYEAYTDKLGFADPLERDSKYLEDIFGKDTMKIVKDCAKELCIPIYTGVGTLNSAQWAMWGNLTNGKNTVQQVIDMYKPTFEAQCEYENNLRA